MNEAIFPELLLLALSCAAGLLCVTGYDLLCILRILLRIPLWLEKTTDLLYWCMAGFAVFSIIHEYNSGVIRAYSLLAIAGGMLFYQKLLHKPIYNVGENLKKQLQKHQKQSKMKKEKKKQVKSGIVGNEDENEQKA